MPHFDIVRSNEPQQTFRVASIIGTYDLQKSSADEHFSGDINLPNKWNIGLIVGRSGTGKSTIARELFGQYIIDGFTWGNNSILDDMPAGSTTSDISKMLCAVGFSSPVDWLKPYSVLSNGEKMRCDLARALLENRDIIVFDEFTSVVDRTIAKVGSMAVQKAIRRANKKFIAVTCHHDVKDWLQPDWVFNTDSMTFQQYDAEMQKKNKPTIKLDVYEIKGTSHKLRMWQIFKKYHYLSHTFNDASRVFVCLCNEQLAGFCGVLHLPHPRVKNIKKEHRVVVLPDFQGIGIGSAFTDEVARMFHENGCKYTCVTSNPSMIMARKRNKKWALTRFGREKKQTGILSGTGSNKRLTARFIYKG